MNTQTRRKCFLSLFPLSHQWAWQGVFIGAITPPRYNYAFAPLQRSYSRNIPKCTCNFARATWVRYSSDGPVLPDDPLRPSRRRSWDPFDNSSPWRLRRSVFAYLRLTARRPAKMDVIYVRSWRWLQHIHRLVFANLRRPIRRWCPQQDTSQINLARC